MKFAPAEMAQEGRWTVGVDDLSWVTDNGIVYRSSYHVVGARLLGLSYPNYLRYLQSCGGELKGREGYSFVYFKDKAACQKVCKELQKRWDAMERRILEE